MLSWDLRSRIVYSLYLNRFSRFVENSEKERGQAPFVRSTLRAVPAKGA